MKKQTLFVLSALATMSSFLGSNVEAAFFIDSASIAQGKEPDTLAMTLDFTAPVPANDQRALATDLYSLNCFSTKPIDPSAPEKGVDMDLVFLKGAVKNVTQYGSYAPHYTLEISDPDNQLFKGLMDRKEGFKWICQYWDETDLNFGILSHYRKEDEKVRMSFIKWEKFPK